MARLSQEIILNMAEKIIYEKGMEKTTLYDIASNLNVTHAALYKHYRNKEDLFQKLALRWLEETSREIFAWTQDAGQTPDDALHDSALALGHTKKKRYKTDRKMFLLYTDYIEQNEELVKNHVAHLAQKARKLAVERTKETRLLRRSLIFIIPILRVGGSKRVMWIYLRMFGRLLSKNKERANLHD